MDIFFEDFDSEVKENIVLRNYFDIEDCNLKKLTCYDDVYEVCEVTSSSDKYIGYYIPMSNESIKKITERTTRNNRYIRNKRNVTMDSSCLIGALMIEYIDNIDTDVADILRDNLLLERWEYNYQNNIEDFILLTIPMEDMELLDRVKKYVLDFIANPNLIISQFEESLQFVGIDPECGAKEYYLDALDYIFFFGWENEYY